MVFHEPDIPEGKEQEAGCQDRNQEHISQHNGQDSSRHEQAEGYRTD